MVKEPVGTSVCAAMQKVAAKSTVGTGVPKALHHAAGDGLWTDEENRPWMLFNLRACQKRLCWCEMCIGVDVGVCCPRL